MDVDSAYLMRPRANDRWKARWSSRLAGGIIAAVALHASVFAFWPEWEAPAASSDEAMRLVPTSWITLYELPAGGSGGLPAIGAPVSEVSDSAAAEPALQESTGSSEGHASAEMEDLRKRLLGGRVLQPTVSNSGSDLPPDEEVTTLAGGDSTSIEGSASTAEVPEAPGADELMLDRLSDLHPGLALSSSSAWVLLRNPLEVERFMEENPGRQWLSGGSEASVTVTVWIDESGSVGWAEVHASSGREKLDEIAMALFTEVVAFRPALDRGIPVPKSATFTINFPW